jgi:hypothetical protein
VPRAADPLATFLYLLARNALPYGQLEKVIQTAQSEIVPEMLPDDPVAAWAAAQAGILRGEASTDVVP